MGDIPSCHYEDDGEDEECKFPDYIEMGYKLYQGEWEEDDDGGHQVAAYRCYPPYAMQNIDIGDDKPDNSYIAMYGVAY